MASTDKGAPYPLPGDPDDVPAWMLELATWVDLRPGIATLTEAARDDLTGDELWPGRTIYNATTDRLEQYDSADWSTLVIGAELDLKAPLEDPAFTVGATVDGRPVITDPPLLAVTSYGVGDDPDPGDNEWTTTTNVVADVDAAHAKVTFTAPTTGRVLVRLTALTHRTDGEYRWALRAGAATVAERLVVADADTVDAYLSYSVALLVTGLAPGTAHTYKWAHRTTDGGGSSRIYAPADGPLLMEVWTAP